MTQLHRICHQTKHDFSSLPKNGFNHMMQYNISKSKQTSYLN